MRRMIKAGLFDVGGVLHSRTNKAIYQDITKTLGISWEEMEKTEHRLSPKLSKGKISEEVYWQMFVDQTKPNGSLPDISLFLREFAKQFHPYDDMLALVKKLKDKGYKTGVVSDTIPVHVDFLKKQGMFDNFDICVFSYNEGTTKPNDTMYRDALLKLNVKPEEAFFVDDIEDNIKAAEEMRIHGIVFKDYDSLVKQLQMLQVAV